MTKKDKASLESNIAQLQMVITTLESDEIELDKALQYFEQGVGLVKATQKLLSEADQKIQLLVDEGSQSSDVEDSK